MYTSKDFPAYPEESKACDELNVNFYSLFYISCMCIHIVVKSEVCSLSDHFRSQNSNFLLSFPVWICFASFLFVYMWIQKWWGTKAGYYVSGMTWSLNWNETRVLLIEHIDLGGMYSVSSFFSFTGRLHDHYTLIKPFYWGESNPAMKFRLTCHLGPIVKSAYISVRFCVCVSVGNRFSLALFLSKFHWTGKCRGSCGSTCILFPSPARSKFCNQDVKFWCQ